MYHKEAIEELVAEVLDGTPVRYSVDSYQVSEVIEVGRVVLKCGLHDAKTGKEIEVNGEGVGLVDAFFNGLIGLLSAKHESLKTIRLADFAVKAQVETGHDARTDSAAEVTLRVANSEGVETPFSSTSQSVIRSALQVVLGAVEFYCNSERAVIEVYRALQRAKHENRYDSVALYTRQLTTLVEATSYTDVLDKIRNEALGN